MRPVLLAAAVLLIGAPAASADVAPTGRCTPANTTILFDTAVGERGDQGEATGVQKIDGVWTFLRCEIALDPKEWARDTPAERCQIVVHELVHLARVDDVHAPSGVMAAVPGYFPPCHTIRERVKHDLMARLRPDDGVICGRGRSVFFCRTFTTGRDGWQVERRYRVRVKGQQYSIKRMRDHA